MLFSVVTVTYNAGELLERTIKSVLSQNLADFEYLIVDGDSSDGTIELINTHSSRLGYWISEKDTGIYNAMNKALPHCKGEWVIFMNAGDVFSDENVLSNITPHCRDDIDLIYGDRHRVNASGIRRYEKAGDLKDAYSREVVFHQSLFTRTKLLQERNYDESYKLAADYEFMLYALRNKKKLHYVELSVSDFLEGGASRDNFLLAQIEAIKASLHHCPDKEMIKSNYYLESVISQNIGRILTDKIQTSQRLNSELKIQPTTTTNGTSLTAINGTPELEQLLHRINQSLRPVLSPDTNHAKITNTPAAQTQIQELVKKLKVSENCARNFETLKAPIQKLRSTSLFRHPLAKYKAYKELLRNYQNIKPSRTIIANQKNIPEQLSDIKSPFFSIVTVTYNAEEFLQKTIDSIISQSFKDFEYIIIDGGSTDNTSLIIKNNSVHITKWISERDSGIYDAMNKGIRRARGKWINFMNAGDTFTNTNVLAKVAQSITHDSDVIYGDRNYLKGGSKTLQKAKDISTIFERMPFGHQSTFVRTQLLKEFEFNDTYKFAADYNLLMSLYCKGYTFQKLDITICDFLAGGQSESGLRPYLESIKILLDHTNDKTKIARNAYFSAFRRNNQKLLNEACSE